MKVEPSAQSSWRLLSPSFPFYLDSDNSKNSLDGCRKMQTLWCSSTSKKLWPVHWQSKEGWKKEHQKSFEAGLTFLPPKAEYFGLASLIDFEFMEPVWEAAVVDLSVTPSLKDFAQQRGGTIEKVAGVPAVALPSDTYVVKFAAQTAAAMSPANRQAVARWIKEVRSREGSRATLSPYLMEGVDYADRVGTEIIMALDLTDVLTAHDVHSRLDSMECLSGKNVDVDQLTNLLVGVRGLTLGIRIGKKPFGRLKVDFNEDASLLADDGKALLLEILSNQGAMIGDFEKWKAKVRGKTFSIEGHLTQGGMTRIFSIVDVPEASMASIDKAPEPGDRRVANNDTDAQPTTPDTDSPDPGTAGGSSPEDYASQTYFQSIEHLLDDLEQHTKSVKTIGSVNVWMDRYARKIDRLPMLNVDGDLLDYGNYVSGQLRNASNAVKGIGIQSASRQAHVYQQPGYRYGRYGYFGGATNVRGERRAVRYAEKAKGATSAIEIYSGIENATASIRRDMTERYQMNF